MKKSPLLWVATALVSVAVILSPAAVAQGGPTGVTGAAAAAFPDGATLNGVSLSALDVGTGSLVDPDGTASGHVLAVLHGTVLGQPREIVVEGVISGGTISSAASATLSGTATVDMGGGSIPLELPLTVTATAESLLLTLGSSALPSATLTAGSITIG
jgi:hypothetical protein